MKDQYDDFDDNDQPQHIGLGSNKRKMTKNQQIYGDFYEAYQQSEKMNVRPTSFRKSAYSHFKAGSTIQNYAAQCQIDIPQPKPKKKVKTIQEQQQQLPEVGQFNLQSFLREYQQKQELQQIDQEEDQDSYNGPFCLNQKIKSTLRLVKIGQEDEDMDEIQEGQISLNQMTFQQYRKLVMRNGKKQQEQIKKKKLTPQQKDRQKQFIEGYGKGYKMLEKMGFNISKGLGKQEKGIQKPVQAVFKTSFTTKDSQLKQEKKKEQKQKQADQQQIPAQIHLFQFRSRNIRINNFLLDLKNKYESINSKMYFYQREVQNFERDFQINNSLKLQKQNQIQQHEQQLKKLNSILEYGKKWNNNSQNIKNDHKQQLSSKHVHPHLALNYKLDVLYIKNQYLKLKGMKQNEIYDKFPDIIAETNNFLSNFYLQKQRQTIKGYQTGFKSFKDKNHKVINLEEEVIDLIDQGPTEQQSVASVSFQDQQKIVKMIELIAQNTIFHKIAQTFARYRHIGDIKNFKILQCLRSLKVLNKNSQIVQNIITAKIKPLLFNYYDSFQFKETFTTKIKQNQVKPQQQQILPHLIIFPLFQIMNPKQLELDRLLKHLSRKLWSLKSQTLYKIIKPLLSYCPEHQRQHFINFYLAPRLMYHMEEFDLTQPHVCKQLIASLKLYKQFFEADSLKDLLNCTIIPEIVMTYNNYSEEGMNKEQLSSWLKRWSKEIGKIVPYFLEETLFNDFHIQI